MIKRNTRENFLLDRINKHGTFLGEVQSLLNFERQTGNIITFNKHLEQISKYENLKESHFVCQNKNYINCRLWAWQFGPNCHVWCMHLSSLQPFSWFSSIFPPTTIPHIFPIPKSQLLFNFCCPHKMNCRCVVWMYQLYFVCSSGMVYTIVELNMACTFKDVIVVNDL